MPETFTRLYLVRHGGTTSSAANLFAGSTNPALSDDGRAQVRKLSERLKDVDLAAAYCSDVDRAVETARIICEKHQLNAAPLAPIAMAGLREISHGHWEGKEHGFVEREFADEYQAWSADPMRFAPAGGETGESVLRRARPAIDTIVANHPGKSVLVVSHTATNRLLLCALLGVDPARYRDRFSQDLACLNVLDFRGELGVRAERINDVSHYDADARA